MVEDRIRAALREIVAAYPVPLEERRVRRWPAVAMAGLAVASIVAVIALLPVWSGDRSRPVVAAGQRPTLPETFPPYAFGQGVMDGPFGRAIAFYHNGAGHEDWSFSQLIVAGADENKYRQVRVPGYQLGIGIYARLTPDGTKIVTGGANGVLTVIDLLSGVRKDYPTVATLYTAPLAVSADSRLVAYSVYFEFPTEGLICVLDLETGQVSPTLGVNAQHVAFSPSGALAIQIGQTVKVTEWSGEVTREIQLPDSTELAGPQSWTPDGRFLVTLHEGPVRVEGDLIHQGDRSYVFMPVDESTKAVPKPVPGKGLLPGSWGDSVLGWRSPTTMLVSGNDVNGTTSNLIVEVDITTGAHRVMSRFRVGRNADLAVGDVQLATGLLAEMGMRSGANPDRGVWPTWLIVTVVLCFVPMLTVIVWRRTLGRPGRRRPEDLDRWGGQACD